MILKDLRLHGGNNKSTIRKIENAALYIQEEKIIIELVGNGFLYNMVRIIAGTLVDVGLGKIKPEDICDIIQSKNRNRAGKTLPPHGLYLVEVYY